jgi:hypothetical protein
LVKRIFQYFYCNLKTIAIKILKNYQFLFFIKKIKEKFNNFDHNRK